MLNPTNIEKSLKYNAICTIRYIAQKHFIFVSIDMWKVCLFGNCLILFVNRCPIGIDTTANYATWTTASALWKGVIIGPSTQLIQVFMNTISLQAYSNTSRHQMKIYIEINTLFVTIDWSLWLRCECSTTHNKAFNLLQCYADKIITEHKFSKQIK